MPQNNEALSVIQVLFYSLYSYIEYKYEERKRGPLFSINEVRLVDK